MIYLWLIVSALLGSLGQILMKIAMNRAGPSPEFSSGVSVAALYFARALFSSPMIGAVAAYALSFLLWLAALSRTDLSLARPFVSISYLVVAVYGYFAGERLSWERVLGIALITVGLFFVARSGLRT
ncbi:MAG: EamA family transporter [Leptospirales bacterium]|nr:EamA family transporter [Leptospirales bacterium]